MRWVLYGFGILYIVFGAYAVLYTETCRRWVSRIWTDSNMKLLAVVAGVLGLLLILAAAQSRNSWFMVLMGVLGVAKCLLFLFGPANLRENLIRWFLDTSDQTWRLYGIIGLVLGTAITSWVI